jgi:glyceraldehyde 3-phosphate dehydrogenase
LKLLDSAATKIMVNLSVNGFGRIGRLVTRLIVENQSASSPIHLVHVNEMHGDATTSAYLLQFDSTHGRWPNHECTAPDPHTILITNTTTQTNHSIRFSNEADPAALDLTDVDMVVECTGVLKTRALLAPLLSKVQKIIVSAPMKEEVPNVVMGVNHSIYMPDQHAIVTAASCTTNAIAPVVKVLHEHIGIKHGMITTIHNTTNTQCAIDTAWPGKKEIRRTRSAGCNLIPTTTGSAKAITQIFPELNGLLDGRAVRTPMTVGGSIVDAVFEMKGEVTVEQINALMQQCSENGELVGILGYEDRPLVSTDYNNDSRSGIVDGGSTMVINKTMLKMYVWYDNEWGYSCRMWDLIQMVVKGGSV